MQHDKVDFTTIAAVVAANQLTAPLLKVAAGGQLALSADLLPVRSVPG